MNTTKQTDVDTKIDSIFNFFSQDTVSKYNVKMREGNREVDETIEIDTEKQTEKIHIPSNGDSSNSAPGEVDVVYDFNLVSKRVGVSIGSILTYLPTYLPSHLPTHTTPLACFYVYLHAGILLF